MSDEPAGDLSVSRSAALSSAEVDDVLSLSARAEAVDGTAAVSESSLIALKSPAVAGSLSHIVAHLGSDIVGYAAADAGPAGLVIELVVDPAQRRKGVASGLLRHLGVIGAAGTSSPAEIWAHGNLGPARALAKATGLRPDRVLWQMRRSLAEDFPEPHLPPGVLIRAFRVGVDDEAWVRVNARAFSTHPEQGSWTMADLQARQAESWFDATGFLVAELTAPLPEHPELRVGDMAGSHWTKVHPSEPDSDGPIGEVYVVGIDPDAQGLGLGKALTLAGLRHLRSLGLSDVLLYVDEDNKAAMRLYQALGFTRYASDVQYTNSPA